MSLDVAISVYETRGFLQKLRGLLGRSELSLSEVLYIPNCNHVHSVGMKYALDVVFLSESGKVIRTAVLEPNRRVCCKKAKSTLEFKAGAVSKLNIRPGNDLSILTSSNIGDRHEV